MPLSLQLISCRCRDVARTLKIPYRFLYTVSFSFNDRKIETGSKRDQRRDFLSRVRDQEERKREKIRTVEDLTRMLRQSLNASANERLALARELFRGVKQPRLPRSFFFFFFVTSLACRPRGNYAAQRARVRGNSRGFCG